MTDLLEQRSTLLKTISILLIAFAAYMSFLDGRDMQSADLLALWLAGDFLATGQPEQVYPTVGAYFDMRAPDGWLERITQTMPDARIYPFIYPPIWAKLASFMTPLTSFAAFDAVMAGMHQVLLIWGVYLAAQMCGLRKTLLWVMVALTYAVLVLTMPIGIALGENQPQILVSFLIVAAFSRAHRGHLRSAGALLALAASIKVYPLFFIVIFIGRKQWGALGAFVIAGAGLALASVILAGWPLHAEYIHLLSVVSRSVILTTFSFSFDAIIAMVQFGDTLIEIEQTNPASEAAGWSVVAKTATWITVSGVAQISALVGVAVLAARKPHDPLVMPFAAAVFALLSPLSWAYTYLTTLFFLGAMVVRLGPWGVILLLAFFTAFHPATADWTLSFTLANIWAFWVIGSFIMIALAVGFGAAILRTQDASDEITR